MFITEHAGGKVFFVLYGAVLIFVYDILSAT
jgi:hypothetical protein